MRQYILSFFFIIGICTILHAQCYPDRHSTNWFDGWISCDAAPRPDGSGEKGHWIMYDFGDVYKLGQMSVWNTNDPSHLDWGMRDVLIETSLDGDVWTVAGNFTFEQANGLSTYEGFVGPDLGGVEGRFLLITAQTNWGGECYGISEIKIAAEEIIISSTQDLRHNDCFTITATPNPFSIDTDIEIVSQCPGKFEYSLIDVLGRVVRQGDTQGQLGTFKMKLNMQELPQGTYYLKVQQSEHSRQLTLVKFNKA